LADVFHLLRARLEAEPPRQADGTGRRWASVAVILAPDPLSILLIRRSERGGDPWSGHVALPGGRRSPADPDLIATAIRETGEEVAVTLARDQLLGALDDVAPSTAVLPAIAVRPYVFGLGRAMVPGLSHEVADARWEPVTSLLAPEARGEYALARGGSTLRFPAYHTSLGTLWGMTQRILDSILPILAQASAKS
jgi:8-oxo-dGTP pyrophosphatase MutT (NUDIX family)